MAISLLHLIHLLAVGAFAYHALYVWRLARSGESEIPFTGVIPMTISAGGYYLAIEAMWQTQDILLLRALRHLMWLCGLSFVYFSLIAIQSFLQLEKTWLIWARRLILVLVVLATLSLFGLLIFDHEFLFSRASGFVPPELPETLGKVQSWNYMTTTFALLLTAVEFVCYSYFLRKLHLLRPDFWLSAGIALSLLAVLNEIFIGSRFCLTNYSFLFVAQFLEIIRLTTLINRENRERTKRVEDVMRLAQIGELTAIISHELRTPLTVTTIAVDSLARNASNDSPIETDSMFKLIKNAQLALKSMRSLIENIGRGARAESDAFGAFDVGQSVRDCVRMVGLALSKEGILFDQELGDSAIRAFGNDARFQQVLFNLIQNAMDATEGKIERKVSVSARVSGKHVEVRIRDNGCGISQDLRKRIFEPFFTTKAPGRGTGIGLAFAAKQIDKMGGKIRFDSVPGEGTEFVIELQGSGT